MIDIKSMLMNFKIIINIREYIHETLEKNKIT